MSPFESFGRILLVMGIFLVVIGLAMTVMSKITGMGRLPGDIFIQKGNFSFYFPLATSVIISLLLTVIFSIFARR